MYTVNNILDANDIERLIKIIDLEIETNFCNSVPLYQSYNNMHIKYAHEKIFHLILKKVNETTTSLTNKSLTLKSSWFNICRKNSNFSMHTHPTANFSAVFYIRGCKNEGTIFKINDTLLKVLSNDNSLIFFDPSISHTIPVWNGVDRYTMAFDFVTSEM